MVGSRFHAGAGGVSTAFLCHGAMTVGCRDGLLNPTRCCLCGRADSKVSLINVRSGASRCRSSIRSCHVTAPQRLGAGGSPSLSAASRGGKASGQAVSVEKFGRTWHRRCVAAGASNGATAVGRQSSNGTGSIAAPRSTVIIGAGPTGLAMATMLAQRGWKNIEVWERRQPPPPPDELGAWGDVERSYNLGISARGQNVLQQLGALELVLRWCAGVTGRHDWSPGGPEEGVVRDTSYRDYTVQVMPRDRLASCLLLHVREQHSDAVRIRFGAVCTSVRWEKDDVLLTCKVAGEAAAQQVRCDFLVGADGSGSAVMQAMATEPSSSTGNDDGEFLIHRLPGRITRLYRTLRMEVPPSWRGDTNYAARTEQGHVLEMLPTREGVLFGALLFREDDPIVPAISTEAQARDYFKRNFPQMYPHIADEEFSAFAQRSLSRLPNFQYCGPRLHRGGNTVVLGDCIHTVKPYYGLGVNSALEDVAMLSECLQQHGETDLPSALRSFSSRRAKDAEALVQMSHAYDGEFFRRVLPFLLDTALHSAFPSLLRPPTMRAMQSTDYGTFHQVRERKRAERVVVFSLLAAVPACAASLAHALAALPQ